MPLFGSSSPFDADVEKATSELNTSEDWGLFLDICDKAKQSSNAAKDCLRSIVKRLKDRVPHVAMQALTLLNACVKNCGHIFHLEIASRGFVGECKEIIETAHPKVSLQLKLLIKAWSEGEFKSDSSLSLIPSFYSTLKSEGHSFVSDEVPKSRVFNKDPNVVSSQEEEEDIAKAIALSMKEAEKQNTKSSSIYPAFNSNSVNNSQTTSSKVKEPRKVKALYDFEAVEDNELTFKAGEIIGITDDSDPNWWKGVSWRGEGLFPANFVTPDLNVAVDEPDEEETKPLEVVEVPKVIWIDEEKIDQTLAMIQNADPTGERCPDPHDMMSLEEQCKCMGPLIDQELEKIDKNHGNLMELHGQLTQALQLYNDLMRDMPLYGYKSSVMPPSGYPAAAAGVQTSFPAQQPPSYMALNQMFPTYSMSMGQIPQGIAAQVGSMPSLPSQDASQLQNVPGQTYMFQDGTVPAYYDLAQQSASGSHAMPTYAQPNSLPMTMSGPASLPFSGIPGYNMSSPSGMSTSHPSMNQQTRLV